MQASLCALNGPGVSIQDMRYGEVCVGVCSDSCDACIPAIWSAINSLGSEVASFMVLQSLESGLGFEFDCMNDDDDDDGERSQ